MASTNYGWSPTRSARRPSSRCMRQWFTLTAANFLQIPLSPVIHTNPVPVACAVSSGITENALMNGLCLFCAPPTTTLGAPSAQNRVNYVGSIWHAFGQQLMGHFQTKCFLKSRERDNSSGASPHSTAVFHSLGMGTINSNSRMNELPPNWEEIEGISLRNHNHHHPS